MSLSSDQPLDAEAKEHARLVEEYIREFQGATEEERREEMADPLPSPAQMTLGLLDRITRESQLIHNSAGASPGFWDGKYTERQRRALIRRELLLNQTPGLKELVKYLNHEFGESVTLASMKQLYQRLARELDLSFEEVSRFTCEDALRVLRTNASEKPKRESTGDPVESAKPKKTGKRRGRTAGVNKIEMALTELRRRLKEGGEPTGITALAKAVGCEPENLARSRRFKNAHRELTDGMARVPKYGGSKEGGNLEAWDREPKHSRDYTDYKSIVGGYIDPPPDINDDSDPQPPLRRRQKS
jgi:hypothetical protein